jgi:hypothetical protein
VLGWLFIGGLAIIWAAFLLPLGHVKPSPASTVEEFERKMDILAEANGAKTGRWVLVPRKGERFLGSRDRTRLRTRHRRRAVFTFLLEMTVLSLIIGLFPPLRPMLRGTVILGGLLVVYTALLLRVQAVERSRARAARARRSAARRAYERISIGDLARAAGYQDQAGHAGSNGNGNGHAARSGSNGHAAAASGRDGRPNGHAAGTGYRRRLDPDLEVLNGRSRSGVEFARMTGRLAEGEGRRQRLFESGVRIVEDDCHVIVRPASEAGGASSNGASSRNGGAEPVPDAGASPFEAAAR